MLYCRLQSPEFNSAWPWESWFISLGRGICSSVRTTPFTEANFLTSSLPLFSEGLGVLHDFQNENCGWEIHLSFPGLPQKCSPLTLSYWESLQYCNNRLYSVHVKVLQPWSNFYLWKAFAWCYLMRNSRAYLAITALLNLRMSRCCSVRMLSLSTDYSQVM